MPEHFGQETKGRINSHRCNLNCNVGQGSRELITVLHGQLWFRRSNEMDADLVFNIWCDYRTYEHAC